MRAKIILLALCSLATLHSIAQSTACWKLFFFEVCYNSNRGFSADFVPELVTPIGSFSLQKDKERSKQIITRWQTRYEIARELLVSITTSDSIYLFTIKGGRELQMSIDGKTDIQVHNGKVDLQIMEGSDFTINLIDRRPSSVYPSDYESRLRQFRSVTKYSDIMQDSVLILQSVFGFSLGESVTRVEEIIGKPDYVINYYDPNFDCYRFLSSPEYFPTYPELHSNEMHKVRKYGFTYIYSSKKLDWSKYILKNGCRSNLPEYSSADGVVILRFKYGVRIPEGKFQTLNFDYPVLDQAIIFNKISPRFTNDSNLVPVQAINDLFSQDIQSNARKLFDQGALASIYGINSSSIENHEFYYDGLRINRRYLYSKKRRLNPLLFERHLSIPLMNKDLEGSNLPIAIIISSKWDLGLSVDERWNGAWYEKRY